MELGVDLSYRFFWGGGGGLYIHYLSEIYVFRMVYFIPFIGLYAFL